MTSDHNISPDAPVPAQDALRELAHGGDQDTAMTTLARSEVLLPDPGGADEDNGDPQAVRLPVFEQQDGTRVVPVFTSEARLAQALPEIQRYRSVPLFALGQGWPSDDLSLTIDAGAPDALTLPSEGVRALALAGR